MVIEGPAQAVIVAAGRSERMGGADKVFAELMGRPLLAWTLRAFKQCPDIDSVVVVASPRSVQRMERFVREWRFDHVHAVVAGGDRRQDSVRAGIEATVGAGIVAIHDGARPLVTPELISRGVAVARECGAALGAVLSRDTVKEAEGEPPAVVATHDRTRIWLAQTPQVFERELILRAHAAAEAEATDDAALVEALGHEVRIFEGSYGNIKVTDPDDLIIAEALLRARFERGR
jgi:2-C-methyl-D-erythritol 4-phosphate cytidylyltransferase